MTETGGTVERINAELNYDGTDHWESGSYLNSDIRALLAVVEAAQEALEYLKVGEPDAAETLLQDPLAALHTQASDEGGE